MRTAEEKTPAAAGRHTTPFFDKGSAEHFFGARPVPNTFFQKSSFLRIQPKLAIGQPNDKYEKEADAVAQKVVSSPDSTLQAKCTECEKEESLQKQSLPEEEELQMQPMEEEEEMLQIQSMEEEEDLQMKPSIQLKDDTASVGRTEASPWIQSRINSSRGSGRPLDGTTRSFMESRMQSDFSSVNIHTGDESVQMNRELGARAFTVGSDIYFNRGEYRPETTEGKKLLAHELTHTVQQQGMIQKQVQKSSDFCKPYATAAEAANAEWWLRNVYMRIEGIETFGTEVYNLYDSYLSRTPGDSLQPRTFSSESSYIQNSFKDDGYIKDDMDAVIDLVGQRLHRAPAGSLRDGVESFMSLSNFLSTSEMENRPINFSNPFSVSGHIAGDIGSSDAGNDYRKITSAIVAITKVVLLGNTGYYLIELFPHYEVFDTIDFCPGDPGAPAETLVTTPMSRLEASGEAYDMPFKVIFSPESRSKRFWF